MLFIFHLICFDTVSLSAQRVSNLTNASPQISCWLQAADVDVTQPCVNHRHKSGGEVHGKGRADIKNILVSHTLCSHSRASAPWWRVYIFDIAMTLSATPWRFPIGSSEPPNDVTYSRRSGVAHGGPSLKPTQA